MMDASSVAGALVRLLGRDQVFTSTPDQARYLTDWRGRYTGRALAVVRPADTAQVSAVVALCARERVSIVPQGGNTGLVGGATPDDSGTAIVLSTERLRAVRRIDPVNDTIVAEAGCTLASLQAAADDVERLFPLSLASEGSCTIGGNLATNAGGTGVLHYGNARDLCLGVEAVLPDGSVVSHLDGLRKDNTGYRWGDLLVGAEGTLGIITAATMKLFPRPRARVTAWVAVASPRAAVDLLSLVRSRCGPTLTAFELVSDFAIALVEKHFAPLASPFAARHPQAVLIETSDHVDEAQARVALEAVLGEAIDAGLAIDVVVAETIARSRTLWALRERISEAQAAEGRNVKHDVSVPISAIAAFIETTDAELRRAFPDVRMVTFGHLGDGNLHYNVSPPLHGDPVEWLAREHDVNAVVHDAVVAHGGSISAEHGIGQLKRDELSLRKTPAEMALMFALKRALDPHGIMNPGKVL